jgi:SAM-dependent methyltransferase/putative flippase GtrA
MRAPAGSRPVSHSLESLMRSDAVLAPRSRVGGQFFAFLLIGGIASGAYVLLSSVAIAAPTGLPDWVVSALCYALFVIPAYLSHRRFTFTSTASHAHALPRYLTVQVSALLLATAFSYVAYGVVQLPTPFAAMLVVGLTAGVNFIVLRSWAFSMQATETKMVRDSFRFDRKSFMLSEHNSPLVRRRAYVLSRHLAATIPGEGTVLDLGCGDGQIAYSLMKLRPDLLVEGVDIVPRAKTLVPVRQYDGVTLPFADKSFDYVTIVDVLHHTDDPAAVLAEASRVARRGVVVKDHLRKGVLAGPTLRLMDWVGNRGHDVRLPYNYLDAGQWATAFERAGLAKASWADALGLYGAPLNWLFERKLHFVALLKPVERGSFSQPVG